MGRHQAEPPVERQQNGRRPPRTSGGFLGWALGAATILLLLWGLWSLADDAPDPPVPGIFGAAARPGTFAPESGGPADTSPMEPTTTTPGSTSPDSGIAVTDSPPDSPSGSSQTESTPLESPPTTFVATTNLPPTTTTTLAPLVLRHDGLDVADLGDSYEEAVATVSARLGDPTEDTGWIDATSDFGICPGTVVRLVRWASLRLLFSDGPTEFGQDGLHFFYYSQSAVGTDEVLDLRTAEVIGLDSTVGDLESAFGEALTIESTIRFGVSFFVEPVGPGLLSGTLSDSTVDGVVTSLGGGFGCGG